MISLSQNAKDANEGTLCAILGYEGAVKSFLCHRLELRGTCILR